MFTFALAILLFVCLSHIAISLFVVLKNSRSRTNQWFFGFTVTMVAWLLSNYYSNDIALSYGTALLINKAVFAFPALTIFCLMKFAFSFTNTRVTGWRTTGLNMAGVFVVAISLTSYVVQNINAKNGVYEIAFGPLSSVFFSFIFVYFIIGIVVLWRAYRRSQGSDRTRLQYVILSLSVGLGISILTNAVLPSLLGNYALSAIGPISTIIISVGFAYAIIRHRLFDIRAVVARSVAYVLLIVTMAVAYGGLGFLGTQLLFGESSAPSSQTFFNIALAVVLALTFQPLRALFVRLTDRLLYRDHYDTQEVLNHVGRILVNEFSLENLLTKTLAALCEQLHIQGGQLYVFDAGRVYKIEHYGPLPAKLMTVPHLEQLHHDILVADELPSGSIQDTLQDYGVRVMMKLYTREEFVGYLLLSDKLSGDVYTSQDVALLEILIQELAVAISNAKAYEDIAEFNRTLEQKVDTATKRLRTANIHLRELDQAKDEFISMASHQLRTPLTSIKGYLSMVLEGDAGKVNGQQEEFLGYAYNSTQRTVSLISDLLNVSRMSAGKFFIEKTTVDLTKLVTEEVQQLQQHAAAKQIKLVFTPPKRQLAPLQLDEGKTRQVVMNFVDNAIYYTQKGTVTVSLSTTGKRVELRVKDSGIGVPKAARSKLFTKFFRAPNAQNVRPDGTGLGLYMAKRVIEDQGGTIIFESVEGRGSTFGFSLPITAKEPHATRK